MREQAHTRTHTLSRLLHYPRKIKFIHLFINPLCMREQASARAYHQYVCGCVRACVRACVCVCVGGCVCARARARDRGRETVEGGEGGLKLQS